MHTFTATYSHTDTHYLPHTYTNTYNNMSLHPNYILCTLEKYTQMNVYHIEHKICKVMKHILSL